MICLGALASVSLLVLGAQQTPQTPRSGTDAAHDQEVSAPARGAATLSELIERAELINPEIAGALRAAEAARARVPQAGALPDPVLGLSIMNFPVAEPSLSREMMTMATVQISERLPFPGKLGLRSEVAGFLADAADLEVERVRRAVVEEVARAYFDTYFIDRALEVTGRNEALLSDFARLTSVKFGVGSGAQPDVLKAQVELTRLADQLVLLRELRTVAVGRLNALLDQPQDVALPQAELPLLIRSAALGGDPRALTFSSVSLSGVAPAGDQPVAPGMPTLSELQRLARTHNPRLRGESIQIRAQEAKAELAGKVKLPDLNMSVGYSRRAGFSDFVSVSVSAPLPVFSGRKQDQLVLEEHAVLEQRRAQLRAVTNDVTEEVARFVVEITRVRDQLLILEDGILPQARTTLSSATASYQVGQVDFLTLLDAQVSLYQHEIDYHRLLADFAKHVASLDRAVGTETLR